MIKKGQIFKSYTNLELLKNSNIFVLILSPLVNPNLNKKSITKLEFWLPTFTNDAVNQMQDDFLNSFIKPQVV